MTIFFFVFEFHLYEIVKTFSNSSKICSKLFKLSSNRFKPYFSKNHACKYHAVIWRIFFFVLGFRFRRWRCRRWDTGYRRKRGRRKCQWIWGGWFHCWRWRFVKFFIKSTEFDKNFSCSRVGIEYKNLWQTLVHMIFPCLKHFPSSFLNGKSNQNKQCQCLISYFF